MNSQSVIAAFLKKSDAVLCARYARLKYPDVNVEVSHSVASRWSYAISCDIIGTSEQQAVAFIKGYAYALGFAWVPEVQCEGDERDRFLTTQRDFYRCGACDAYHAVDFHGDCRLDEARYDAEFLDAVFGTTGWRDVPMPTGETAT